MVYVAQVPDSRIISLAENYGSILLLGCPVCANTSIAKNTNQPAWEVFVDDTTGETKRSPYALMKEIDRIKTLLEERGVSVATDIAKSLCFVSEDQEVVKMMDDPEWGDPGLVDRLSGFDAIIALICGKGLLGIRRRLGKGVKLIPAMETKGTLLVYYSKDESGHFITIDQEKTTL